MEFEYRKVQVVECDLWQSIANIDGLIWSGIYELRVKDIDKDAVGSPFCTLGDNDIVKLFVSDYNPVDNSYANRIIVQNIVSDNFPNNEGVYTRTCNSVGGKYVWSTWTCERKIVDVGKVDSFDDFKNSGVYSGTYTAGDGLFESFIMQVVNNSLIVDNNEQNGCVSQSKFSLYSNGLFSHRARVGEGNDAVVWGDWMNIGAADTTDIQDNSITAQKLSSDVLALIQKSANGVNWTTGLNSVTLNVDKNDGAVECQNIPAATTENAGVMTAEDKGILDKISTSIRPLRYVVCDNSIADCFVYVKFKHSYKDITIQRFKGINDTYIAYYVWDDDGTLVNKQLKYADAKINGTQYTWEAYDYIIVVDFALHQQSDTVATASKTDIYFSPKCFDDIYVNELPTLSSEINELRKIPKQQSYYISTNGELKTTTSLVFWTSSYLYAEAGVRIVKARCVADASNSYVHFYDSKFNHISYLAASGVIPEVVITDADIPEGAKYMRAVVDTTGDVYAKTFVNLNDIAPKTLGVPFDYATALSMDKNVLRNTVEAASAGKCTVLYDSDGYPSLMYRIPIMPIGAFSQDLGDFLTPHPAFVVGGVRKNEIYISVFQTCVYNGHYVSWFGLPSVGGVSITDLKSGITAKGEGWHLETIYERSLLGLLTLKHNSATPRGNTRWGRSSAEGYEHECVKMYNGKLPGSQDMGEGEQMNSAKWINGTQPHTWSHDTSAWGIQDVIGGFHEICDLIKMVDGFLYMAEDNNYSADESTWVNTGVAIDAQNGSLVFSSSVTSSMTVNDDYIKQDVNNVKYDESFDTLPDVIRKRMLMLLITTKLTSGSDNLLGISGVVGSRPAGIAYLISGGATEYYHSGLGYYIIAYDLKNITTHSNMGSRMVYIG